MKTDPDDRPAPPVPQPPPRKLPSWLLGLALSLALLLGWAIYINVAPAPQPPVANAPAPMAAALAANNDLRVLVWRNSIDPQTFAAFEGETGMKIVRDDYDTNEQLIALMDAGQVTHDVVLVSGIDLKHLVDRDLLQPMVPLANRDGLDAELMTRAAVYDPGNAHAVVALWGSVGLGYDAAKVAERLGEASIDGWAALFTPESAQKLADCGIQVVDSPRGVFPVALTYLGLLPDSAKPEDTEAATRAWESIRPSIAKFATQDVAENLADGKTCLALATSGDIYRARVRNPAAAANIRYVIPKEGSVAWFAMLAVPKAAANTAGAAKLIDFLTRADVAARLTNVVGAPTAVRAAADQVLPEIRNDPTLFLDVSAPHLVSEVEPSDAAAALRNRFWQLINAPPVTPAPPAEAPAPEPAPAAEPAPEIAPASTAPAAPPAAPPPSPAAEATPPHS